MLKIFIDYHSSVIQAVATASPVRRCLAIAFTLSLAACQSQAPKPPSQAELNDFARQVESAAIADSTIMQACSALGGPTGSLASAARESWLFVNGPLLDAVYSNLAEQRKDFFMLEQQAYSLEGLRQVHRTGNKTLKKISLDQRGPEAQKKTCQQELDRIEDSRYSEIGKVPGAAKILQDNAKALPEALVSAMDAVQQWRSWPKPGRSFFALSEKLHNRCTGKLTLLTLSNNWPQEAYTAYCDNTAMLAEVCDWGKCRELPPKTLAQTLASP